MEHKEFQLQPGWLGLLDWSNGLPLSRSNYKMELERLKKRGYDLWADWISPCSSNKEIYSSITGNNYDHDEYINNKRKLDINKSIHNYQRMEKMCKLLNGTYIPATMNNTTTTNTDNTDSNIIKNTKNTKNTKNNKNTNLVNDVETLKNRVYNEPSDSEQEEDFYYAESDYDADISPEHNIDF
jgi:hypothetical protein